MRERGVDHPYVHKETIDVATGAAMQYWFTLSYSAVDTFIDRMQTIYQVARLPKRSMNKVDEERLLAPVLGPRLAVEFDPSLLVDYREQLLFTPGRLATRIEPLLNYPGCIVLTDQRIYFQPAQLNNTYDPVLHWEYGEIECIYKRRYLLRQTGLELVLKTGESFFFSFRARRDRDEIYEMLNEQPTLARVERPGLEDMLHKWQRREISNFEYLMFLNNAAGRTRNDLTQYPVFPWILSDYTSESLDLSDPSVFRDLSKPIGALDESRLEYYRCRYESMPRGEEAEGMPPPFLYGTHYSTPGYVLFYLVRMVPQHMLCLQNGKFDEPDRLFRSVSLTWQGCLTNHADVKELIPEFYDLDVDADEWLTNSQLLDLGTTQNRDRVGNVELPPWSHGSPSEFVSQCREALESEYVSKHLHEWIDLIFGYKQQGEEAVRADNVFYYLSYEGAIDLETVDDPVEKCSLESQIQEFGQTPKLLFSTPHPSRNENEANIEIATPDLLPSPRPLVRRKRSRPVVMNTRRGRMAVEMNGSLQQDRVHQYAKPKSFLQHIACTLMCGNEPLVQIPRMLDGLASQLVGSLGGVPKQWKWRGKLRHRESASSHLWHWRQILAHPLHSGEVTCAVLSQDDRTLFSTCKHCCFKKSAIRDGAVTLNLAAQAALSCCAVSPDEKILLVGCWDNRVYMYSMETAREIDRVFAHSDGISAIYMLNDRFITTSWDSTIKIWRYTPHHLVASPIRTFLDCDEPLLCLDVSRNERWGAAGARNGLVYLFNVRLAEFCQQIVVSPERRGDVSSVRFASNSSTFVCMTFENELLQYNLHGERLYSVEVHATGQVRCFDSDGAYAVGGTTNGKLLFWQLNAPTGREVIYEIPRAHETIISSLVVAHDGSIVISGGIDGSLRVWHLEPRPHKPFKRRSMQEAEAQRYRLAIHDGFHAAAVPTSSWSMLAESDEAQLCWDC